MRTFAEKPKATQRTTSPKATVRTRSHLGHSHEVNSILHPQRTTGNRAVKTLLPSKDEGRNEGQLATNSPHLGHDFSRIPVSPAPVGGIQTQLAINKPEGEYEQEADRVAEQVMRMPEGQPERARACGGGSPGCKAEQERLGTERPLEHHLTHVVQQAKGPAPPTVQRKPKEGAETEDAELALGRQLWKKFPAGVVVAFYQATNAEAERRAKEYAERENALAVSDNKIAAEHLTFGAAFSDDTHDVKSVLPALSTVLQAAANKAQTEDSPQPLAGTGPGKIRTLALFSHGTSNWCGIGSDITRSNAAAVIKKIAPALTKDVNVLLYACNVGRSPSEKENWFKGTMEGGGEESLGAKVRDALVEEDLTKSRVWGHTTTGHSTDNWALRVFHGSTGKGSVGEAFAGEVVFGTVERVIAFHQLISEITAKGYALPPDQEEKLETRAMKRINRLMYDCYRKANEKLQYKGASLAEMAPDYPLEVANMIREYWDKTYWAGQRPKLADKLIEGFNLKKSE